MPFTEVEWLEFWRINSQRSAIRKRNKEKSRLQVCPAIKYRKSNWLSNIEVPFLNTRYSFSQTIYMLIIPIAWFYKSEKKAAQTDAYYNCSCTVGDDRWTTHQLGEVSRRTECQCKFSVYFRGQGDSLTKAVMVNTQQPAGKEREQGKEAENIELDTEERTVGGWDALKDVYDNEGHFWITMLIRCKNRSLFQISLMVGNLVKKKKKSQPLT